MSEERSPSPSYWSTVPYPVLSSRTLSDKTKLVYGVIASLTQAKDEQGEVVGYCYASNAYLADIMGCGERTITRSIADLVEAGELIVKDVGTNKTACKHQRRIYTLETYARSIVKTGEVASFGEAGIVKNGEAVFNRIDNKRNDIAPISPTGKKDSSPPDENPDKRFEDFWLWYRTVYCADDTSRAGNKGKARKAWHDLAPNDKLIARMGAYLLAEIKTEQHQRGYGIPYASTFLNGVRKGEIDLTVEAAPASKPDTPDQQPRQEAWGWGT